jgi:C4-type Zn-finger protein
VSPQSTTFYGKPVITIGGPKLCRSGSACCEAEGVETITLMDLACIPTFGRYSEGYHHCEGCGHRDFDVSSVGV